MAANSAANAAAPSLPRLAGSRSLPPVRNRKLLIPENTAGIPRLKIPAIPSIILIISSTITLISPAGRKAEKLLIILLAVIAALVVLILLLLFKAGPFADDPGSGQRAEKSL